MIRKAEKEDISRIAEILVFVKRIKYRQIFQNDDYSFGELQVISVSQEYDKPEILNHMWVYDDGIVKGLIHIIWLAHSEIWFLLQRVGKELFCYLDRTAIYSYR
jgi:putative acetyltransferase